MEQDIIVDNTLAGLNGGQLGDCLCHAYCHQGTCTLSFNGSVYTLSAGDCLIIRRSDLATVVGQSPDFKVDVVYVTPTFIEICTPQSNYGMRGQLALFNNPIMHLTEEQQKVCALDFDYIRRRLSLKRHHFHRDAMINAIQAMIIDFYDFHAELHGNSKITSQYAQLMEKFLGMLERGDYRQNREISYYADKLFVTPKYLSEVSKSISGFPASYWINRYTALDISRQLRGKKRSLAELADAFGFSSTSYFTRYVQKYLGVSPSELRE